MEKSKLQLIAKYAKWIAGILLFAIAMGADVDFRFTSADWTIELHIK
ncbi:MULTISPECIES: hypothetical protein [Marinobacter]|jgi:hypothetical protein|uniref:Uncharacterized protein n=1 Tax=Marinobacter sp. MMG032 TaxID=3158548 RepID=A0AAU7MTC1_9GAMM|nr:MULTISPECIES: hypothetical protein [Marinobacter]MCK5865523.1 hypothetical protein [Marinobacter adhaerens]MBY5939034.1 hypothetical protein [Marinobacter nauticus]MBY5956451.1 hypothetical protein [Marinobacter nauticus]MBY6010265.1 hypothetical protein [Marinobacter nauticus]ROQ49298.1 hypothetical protein EDB94_0204 [Marinobacter sp. 3-2]|tara:strand:- start:3897 stop:4037 length:141 start_codon:yes stop_codon:yes gene_type:complete